MSAKENQGLQIAVMIFFGLVVLLAVLTYVFFKSADDRAKLIADMKGKAAKAEQLAFQDRDEINKYKAMMGFTAEDLEETITKSYEEDMKKFSAGYAGDAKTYRTLLQHLQSEKSSVARRETQAKQREQALKARVAALENQKEKQIVTYKDKFESIEKDVVGVRSNFETELARITQSSEKVRQGLEKKNREISNLRATNAKQVKDLGKKLQEYARLNSQKTELLRDREKQAFQSADGKITWVNQRSNVVWINLGKGDLLRRQVVFSVYPADASASALTEKKGTIEVTRIVDQHMAEARIVDSEYSDPILPGDKIHSPVWTAGQRDAFALVGFLDVDGDGRSDRQRVRDLISLNGGDIDCEMDEKGEVEGELKITTKYLVVGDAPTSKTSNKQVIESFTRLTGEAQQLGIEKISLKRFATQLGWRPEQRTVKLGSSARPTDFKAKPRESGQRTGNTSSGFRKRQAPATTF